MSSLLESEKLAEVDFKWGKKRGVGGKNKEVQFYESFTYDGVDYALFDCVYMYNKDEPAPYIAKLVKIWENGDKSRKIKVHWFFRPSEISNHLGGVKVLENELFFASGEGKGLANINPLESIAGKCNVVCISTDNRNPQPPAKDIKMADYIFYRVFDVKSLTISDKMDDKVGGLEVKYAFNRREGASALISKGSDADRNVVTCIEAPKLAGNNSTQPLKNVKQGNNIDLMSEEDKNETLAPLKQGNLLGNSSKNKVTSGTTIKKRSILGAENVGGNVSVVEVEFIGIKSPANEVQVEEGVKSAKKACKNTPSISDIAPCDETPRPSTTNALPNGTLKSGIDKDFEGSRQGAKLIRSSTTMERPLKGNVDLTKEKSIVGHENFHELKYKKRASSSCPKEGSIKKAKFDDTIKQMEDGKKCVGKTKNLPTLGTLKVYRNKEKDDKLSKEEKVGVQVIEVTRRPTEKSKWIKLSWEEKMKTAHDEEKLVLLQNLDPEYTSGEVEDIIWHVFQERCTAKMVQQTAISNPHSGQAFVVFGSRDAANRVLQKLDDGCLMLPNQRPLVGCLGVLPKLSGKQTPFVGHLSIDKARLIMQRELKEAVATSHYSQNNTIEYEMAMDWCLLQSRSDEWWKLLHQQQTTELAKHTQSKRKRTPIEQSN